MPEEKKRSILVVDDDKKIRKMLQKILEDDGYSVEVEESADYGVKNIEEKLAQEKMYDLIMTDIKMPNMDGYEFVKEIRKRDFECGIILITAYADIDSLRRAIQLNVDDYLPKPLSLGKVRFSLLRAFDLVDNRKKISESEKNLEDKIFEATQELKFRTQALEMEQGRTFGIFSQAHFGIVVIDALSDDIFIINKEAIMLLGIKGASKDKLLFQNYTSVIPEEIAKIMESIALDVKEKRKTIIKDKVKTSEDIIIHIESYPVIFEGNITSIVFNIYEMTEKVMMEKQLVQSSKLAGIGELTAGIAHEINNPVGFVKSNTEVLKEYLEKLKHYYSLCSATREYIRKHGCPPKEDVEKHAQEIADLQVGEILSDSDDIVNENMEGLERIEKIVMNLKRLSHVSDDVKEETDINLILEDCLNILRNELKYKVTVKKKFGTIEPLTCYPNELSQVFINIINNAAQAIEEKGTISIETFSDDKKVIVKIADTGKGMDEKTKEHIFDAFFTTKKVGIGTGLGLSITHKIIAKHNGKIFVDSVMGKGTTFTIELPKG